MIPVSALVSSQLAFLFSFCIFMYLSLEMWVEKTEHENLEQKFPSNSYLVPKTDHGIFIIFLAFYFSSLFCDRDA